MMDTVGRGFGINYGQIDDQMCYRSEEVVLWGVPVDSVGAVRVLINDCKTFERGCRFEGRSIGCISYERRVVVTNDGS